MLLSRFLAGWQTHGNWLFPLGCTCWMVKFCLFNSPLLNLLAPNKFVVRVQTRVLCLVTGRFSYQEVCYEVEVKSILIRKKEIFTVIHFPTIGKIVLKMLTVLPSWPWSRWWSLLNYDDFDSWWRAPVGTLKRKMKQCADLSVVHVWIFYFRLRLWPFYSAVLVSWRLDCTF